MGFIMAGRQFLLSHYKETPLSIYSTGHVVTTCSLIELQENGDTRGHIVFTPSPSWSAKPYATV